MLCPSCQQIVSPGAAYCSNCGYLLQSACEACGAMNLVSNQYCTSCGSRMGAEGTSAGAAGVAAGAPSAASSDACPRCGRVNEPGSIYCHSCGLPLNEPVRRVANIPAIGRPAGFWIRLAAWIVDSIVLVIVDLLVLFVWPGVTIGEYFDPFVETSTAIEVVLLVIQVLYFTVGVSVWSTTVGKRVFGMYVLRPDGSKVGPGRAFARWLGYIPSALLLLIGFFMIGFSRDKRGLHDLICDTVVVIR